MKFQIVVLNGSSGVGKDTFAQFCSEYVDYCSVISTIDCTKAMARKCGWKETDTDADRKFLSDLKRLTIEYDNIPFKNTVKEVNRRHMEILQICQLLNVDQKDKTSLVFIRCKEPDEIEKLVQHFKAVTLLITRKGVDVNLTNESDANVLNYKYDFVIGNDGSLEDLKFLAKEFVERIF